MRFCAKCNGHEGAKNQRESFKSAVRSDGSFMTTSEGLIAAKEIDYIQDCSLLECTAPLEGQALHAINVGQSNVLHFELEEEGIGRFGIAQEESFHHWSALHLYRGKHSTPSTECWTNFIC